MSCTCKFLVKTFIGTRAARVPYTCGASACFRTHATCVSIHIVPDTPSCGGVEPRGRGISLHPLLPSSPPSLSHSVAVPPPRNYEVIGDICESSFNPFAPSMNMQKRRQNEPTMFRCARRRSKRRGIRSADAPSLRASPGSMFPDLLNERRIARRSRGDRQSTRRGLSSPASKCLLRRKIAVGHVEMQYPEQAGIKLLQ